MTEKNNTIGRQHWIVFIVPIVVAVIALVAFVQGGFFRELSYLLFILALALAAMNWVSYFFTQLVITPRSIIVRKGLFTRDSVEVPFGRIESININQSIFGQLFNYGSLMVVGTGGTHHGITQMDQPLLWRQRIETAIQTTRNTDER